MQEQLFGPAVTSAISCFADVVAVNRLKSHHPVVDFPLTARPKVKRTTKKPDWCMFYVLLNRKHGNAAILPRAG